MLATLSVSAQETPLLDGALATLEEPWLDVLNDPTHEVALRYTRIDRDESGRATFETFSFGSGAYFYPASTVKLPAVLLALERWDGGDFPTMNISASTPLRAADGRTTTLRRAIREILLISDNDAFNILFDLVGAEALSAGMQDRGYEGTRIFHRLAGRTTGRGKPAGPIAFLAAEGAVLETVPLPPDGNAFDSPKPIPKGNAYLQEGVLVREPMDFARHNSYPLAAQQRTVQALVFPESVAEAARFRLSPEHRDLVLEAMAQFTTESLDPVLAPAEFRTGYARFFVAGPSEEPLPGLRSFGKSGQAYGTTTDNAYVIDQSQGVEFLLAATIYTNGNGTLNDDTYEYETVAQPFLHAVCRAVLDYERGRNRAHPCDFREVRAFLPAARETPREEFPAR